MSAKTSILIIYTGGTIGMVQEGTSRSLKPFNFRLISKNVPELKRFSFKIDAVSIKKPIDSSEVNVENWVELCDIIQKNYSKYDGFVILHGSDTMSHTASALSFMLGNLSKPVILTGSQLPVGAIRTDAKENLITAVEIAAEKTGKKARVPEVCIFFDYRLYRGNRTTKFSSEQFDAFRSPDYPPLAEAGVNIEYNDEAIASTSGKKLKVLNKFSRAIAVVRVFPGMTEDYVNAILSAKKIKLIILQTLGAGNAPTDKWFISALRSAINDGKLIYNVSQCLSGTVDQGKYQTSKKLLEIGVVSGHDISIEAALTKSMFLLGSGLSNNEIASQLQDSIRGELSTH
ncbi:MAG: type I asparaginase [Bacteroidia bacterium]|nr:type I asparaginase [Bacteroidia bacterium]